MTALNRRDLGPSRSTIRDNDEGVAIARLLKQDGESVVGWVYLWEASILSILWTSEDHRAHFVDPPLQPATLSTAWSTGVTDAVAFLKTLAPLD